MIGMQKNLGKPVGRKIGWQRLDTRYPFITPWFRIRQDQVRLPDGHEIEYAYMETRGALWVVPVTREGQVVLIRQYRYPSDDWCWELPAGGLHDHDGSLEELARRELIQEIGATCDELMYVDWFYGPTSSVHEVCHIMLARGTCLNGSPEHEETEFIEIHPMPVDEALSLARRGEMKDGHSALVLLLCEPYLTNVHLARSRHFQMPGAAP